MKTNGTESVSQSTPNARKPGNRCRLPVLLACLICLLIPVTARAEKAELTVDYTFGQTASFTLILPKGHTVEAATLYLQINGKHSERYPAETNDEYATLTRNLSTTPLPPFAIISYWWTFTLPDDTIGETGRRTFQYLDNRYAWKTAKSDAVTVHWFAGEHLAMAQALETAETALNRMTEVLGATPTQTTDIYVYPSQRDLASAMQLAGFEWVGGVAYQELGIVLVAVPPNAAGLLSMQQDIPHELTHRVLYDMLGPEGYASLPTWLDEGLATHFEERPEPERAIVLEEALRRNALTSLSELCLPFPEDADRAYLAYAQSASVVSYIRQTYGWSSLRELIAVYGDGKACATGVRNVLHIDITELEQAWRVWLTPNVTTSDAMPSYPEVTTLWHMAGPWLLLLTALLLPSIALFTAGRR